MYNMTFLVVEEGLFCMSLAICAVSSQACVRLRQIDFMCRHHPITIFEGESVNAD